MGAKDVALKCQHTMELFQATEKSFSLLKLSKLMTNPAVAGIVLNFAKSDALRIMIDKVPAMGAHAEELLDFSWTLI